MRNKVLKGIGINLVYKLKRELKDCTIYDVEMKKGIKNSGISILISVGSNSDVKGVKEVYIMYQVGIGKRSYKDFVLQTDSVSVAFDKKGLVEKLKEESPPIVKEFMRNKVRKFIEKRSEVDFETIILKHFEALRDGNMDESPLIELSNDPYVGKLVQAVLPYLNRSFEDLLLEAISKNKCNEKRFREVMRKLSIDIWYDLFGKDLQDI